VGQENVTMLAAGGTSFYDLFSYLGAHWTGSGGVVHRLVQHLGYSASALAVSAAVALPLGLVTGHTRRGSAVLGLLSNASRALPTLGLLTIFAVLIGVGLDAAIIPLLFIAIPSILVNTAVGIRGVDPVLVDSAKGMGLTPWQVLSRVELPVALPLIVLGFRTAALQVVSTATIAAYVGLGGLGRYIIDGQATRNFAELGAGAVAVVVFAVSVESLFILGQRLVVSPGLRRPAH
jgi:osmoprotectant transport system permease protein